MAEAGKPMSGKATSGTRRNPDGIVTRKADR
jgi:hypothetical protein